MKKILLHIPHSSDNIILSDFSNNEKLIRAIEYHTDWYTNELFPIEKYQHIIFSNNRHFLDVERRWELNEDVIYKKTIFGDIIREKITEQEILKLKDIYDNYHSEFAQKAKKIEKLNKKVIIIDCHSFSDPENKFADFCIGFNNDKTFDPNLIDLIKNYLEKRFFTVSFNNPFEGSIVPKYNYQNLSSVMIEVNKKVYLNNDNKKSNDFYKIKFVIENLINQINKL